jgi:hypothetical protein
MGYLVKNRMNFQIKNSGLWKLNVETNVLEFINDNMSEICQVQLLRKDSLIWQEVNEKKDTSYLPNFFKGVINQKYFSFS